MHSGKTIVPRCHLPWQEMVIDSTGVVAPCCYWTAYDNRNRPVGNINTASIEEIWNGPDFQRLRRGMATGDLKLAGCAKCYALAQGHDLGLEYDAACEQDGSETPYRKNIETLKTEISAGAAILQARPTKLSYTPSHRCNLRCTHCYQESTRTQEIELDRATADVLRLSPYLVQLIAGGGEPFLLPIWKAFLADFKLSTNPYLDFATSTNATVVGDDILAGLARFKKLTINVSLDGTGQVYEAVRVGAVFSKVRDNIRKLKALVEQKLEAGSTIAISMCVMKSTILDLPRFVRFAAEEGLLFNISPVITTPPDESLRCFNDPRSEMQSWDDAISTAKGALDEFYFGALARIRGEAEVDQDRKAFWRHDFDLLRDTIPWHLREVRHRRIRVALPKPYLQQVQDGLGPNAQPIAYIRMIRARKRSAVTYWAPIEDDAFEVSLPDGDYRVKISTKWAKKWASPGFSNKASFSVRPGETSAVAEFMPPATGLSGRRIMSRIGDLIASAKRFWV